MERKFRVIRHDEFNSSYYTIQEQVTFLGLFSYWQTLTMTDWDLDRDVDVRFDSRAEAEYNIKRESFVPTTTIVSHVTLIGT